MGRLVGSSGSNTAMGHLKSSSSSFLGFKALKIMRGEFGTFTSLSWCTETFTEKMGGKKEKKRILPSVTGVGKSHPSA
jgi:hypothetical protein